MGETHPEVFTAHELAARLKVNVITIYRYIKAGTLRAHKIGKEFRISRADFEAWLAQTRTRAGTY